MARPEPDDDPRVTDLARYRKAREHARRKPERRRAPGEGFLGSNPRAALILVVVVLVLAALYLVPRLH